MSTDSPSNKKYYYHITDFEGWIAIGETGIKASDDGYIYMLDVDEYSVSVTLIRSLPSIEPFVSRGFGTIRIDPDGIKGVIEPDTDGLKYDTDYTIHHQFRVKQPLIEGKYLKPIDMQHIEDAELGLDTRKFFQRSKPSKKSSTKAD